MRYLNIIGLFIFCLIFTKTFSQVSIATPDQVDMFYKTTTYVVKDGKPFSLFNSYMKEAVELNWKLTKYKIAEDKDFEKLNQREDLSFIILSEAAYTEKKQTIKLDILNVVLGHKGKGLDDMPDLGSVPLAYTASDEESESEDNSEDKYLYKIPAIIKLIQYQIGVIKQNKINTPQALMDYHNKFTKDIKNKELWLIAEDLSPEMNSLEKIKKNYSYNVKIKTKEELEDAIKRGGDILFAHVVAPFEEGHKGKCWKFVVSAKDGKIYYIESHEFIVADEVGLSLKDFKKLAQ